MTYTVYGAAGSGSVPVEAALTLMRLPYEVVEAVTWEGEAERDKAATVNPMRQIPALVTPAGEVLTESAAILIWLTEQHPEAGLAPAAGNPDRAAFLRWMTFIPASIYALYWIRDDPSRLVGEDPAAQDRVRALSAQRITHCWGVMESQIRPDPFLLGPQPTVLDLYVAVVSRWQPGRDRFAEAAPRLNAAAMRVDGLAELQDFWSRRFPSDPD